MSDEEFEKECLRKDNELKRKLRTAKPEDFQIVDIGEPYPYAASWAGCCDIALFKRKQDCQTFINTFGKKPK
jgi:hypothetical protein